jgi:hypothetical protein
VPTQRLARWFLIAALWLGGCAAVPDIGAAAAQGPDPIEIAAQAVPLSPQQHALDRVGALVYRGGVSLAANDRRFGGWSDLDVSEDGARLTAISDRGFWLEATLVYDDAGGLSHAANARLGSLVNLAGRPQRGLAGDAEGLARAPDGSFFVSFERRHRIWHYPAADPPFSALPRALPAPPGLVDAPENGGIEALVRLPGGRLLALSEELYQGEAHVGWVGDGRSWQRLTYQAASDFKPTGLTRLPSGDLLVLERRFTRLGLPGARIVRLAVQDVVPGARLTGIELARIEPPLTLDNFEGIAARLGPSGETLVYLLSDDNFFFLQRTLLLMFELRSAP